MKNYERMRNFEDGFYGVVDLNGCEIIDPKYNWIEIEKNLIIAELHDQERNVMMVWVFDLEGNFIFEIECESYKYDFKNKCFIIKLCSSK